jgi:hypothetical protein
MEPVEVAKALILGKFGRELAEGLYSGVAVDKIERYLARDLRVVNHEAQQRFVAIIGPGLGLDATSTNVFGTLTPTIDDVLGYTFKAGFALQVGFNYGLVNGDWRRAKVYSSELYALEKLVVEIEGKDASELGEARRATRMIVDHLLSYVKDVYVEFSGHKSFYVAVWLPDPIVKVRAGGFEVTLRDFYRVLGVSLLGRAARRVRGLVDMQFINAAKLLRVPGYLHEATGKPAQYLDADLKPAEFDPGIMDVAVVSPRFITSIVNRIILNRVEWQPRRRPRRRVKLGKLEEWNIVVKYMLNEGIRLNDGRIRFSYVLGNWCAARRMSIDKCRELHNRLVENANTREYQRYLEYGYNHPEYLPWPYAFFRGHEWYSVTDVEVFNEVYGALRGRIRRHVEVKHAPKPEAEPKQSEVEVKAEANTPNSNASTGKAEAGLGGHSSEGKAKPDAAETAGSSTGGAKAPVVEVNTHPNANNPPSEDASTTPEAKAWVVKAPEAKSTHNAEAVVNSHNPSVVGAEPSEAKTKAEAKANQGSQAEPSVVEGLAKGVHWSGGMARINIGDFINHGEAPVEAIVIKQSVIHSEAVEAPANIATVDRIARRLCNSEECLVSARVAIAFIINTVGKGPVRVGWLEDAFKSRHPIHHEVLKSGGIDMWVILTQLRGLGIVVVGDITTPGGWHSRWVTGLVARLLEARGSVSLSELVELVRESEPDLPDAFEGGLTLGDHVAMAVKYLKWRGAAKVEGEAVSLVK